MKKPQQKVQVQKQTARERILQTAHDLFYQNGIRATGIDLVIKEAGVTKVTLYRHFPSKNSLIKEYLDFRHKLWMDWFTTALASTSKHPVHPLLTVISVLNDWFIKPDYRGCAFINGVVELDGAEPWVTEISLRHKQEMADAIAALLPPGDEGVKIAQAAAMAVDGAIIRVQMEKSPTAALTLLEKILWSLIGIRG